MDSTASPSPFVQPTPAGGSRRWQEATEQALAGGSAASPSPFGQPTSAGGSRRWQEAIEQATADEERPYSVSSAGGESDEVKEWEPITTSGEIGDGEQSNSAETEGGIIEAGGGAAKPCDPAAARSRGGAGRRARGLAAAPG